jgi:hypothetical protein
MLLYNNREDEGLWPVGLASLVARPARHCVHTTTLSGASVSWPVDAFREWPLS